MCPFFGSARVGIKYRALSGAGWLFMLGWGAVVLLMWYLQAVVNTSNQTEQSGQEGGDRMVKNLKVSVSNFAANASTAYYVNSLSAITIQAP
ncbi:hypothetical protein [Pseudomonas lini]|uniref:Uncharacterized protein n=1 Tax=Pseudomonas lini TaxID=163011 RepID=A0A1H1YKU8_9PSED|nr:hypothetical protein [Pseudomonas lini]KAB0502786.1 hypothetical protein F7R14_19315 [Pseudomonas lini]SDT21955.1 hypothetical protein SAMN04490191_3537 [Pseudomonas lini]